MCAHVRINFWSPKPFDDLSTSKCYLY